MKRYFILLIFLASLVNLGLSQESKESKVKWYTFEEAVKLNEKEPRKIFIDVYTDWCGWCHKMDATTFNHPEIAKILNEKYYAVKFDAERSDTINFAGKEFINDGTGRRSPHQLAVALLQGKMSYPSVAYMNEQNQLLTAVPGYYSAEQLKPVLMYFADDVFKSQSFQDYQKQLNNQNLTN